MVNNQAAAITRPPDHSLWIRGDELAVSVQDPAVGADRDERVVEGSATEAVIALMHPDDYGHAPLNRPT
jgi:hypothetical protein